MRVHPISANTHTTAHTIAVPADTKVAIYLCREEAVRLQIILEMHTNSILSECASKVLAEHIVLLLDEVLV